MTMKTRLLSLAALAAMAFPSAAYSAPITQQFLQWTGTQGAGGSTGVSGTLSGFSLLINGSSYLDWTGVGSPADGNGTINFAISLGGGSCLASVCNHANSTAIQSVVASNGATLNSTIGNVLVTTTQNGNAVAVGVSFTSITGGTLAPIWGPLATDSASGTGAGNLVFNSLNGYNAATLAFNGQKANVVPEPATWFAGVCLIGLVGFRERRRLRSLAIGGMMWLAGAQRNPLSRRGNPVSVNA